MHVTTKEIVTDEKRADALGVDPGCHILTSIVEADGPFEIASDKAKFSAEVISVKRTASGGVEIQTAFHVREPEAEKVQAPAPAPSQADEAVAYLKEKGLKDDEAKAAVERFGAADVLAKRQADRQAELEALVGQKPASA